MIHTTEPENQRNEESNEGRDRRAPDERVTRVYGGDRSGDTRSLALGHSPKIKRSQVTKQRGEHDLYRDASFTGCACMSVLCDADHMVLSSSTNQEKTSERLPAGACGRVLGWACRPFFEKEPSRGRPRKKKPDRHVQGFFACGGPFFSACGGPFPTYRLWRL